MTNNTPHKTKYADLGGLRLLAENLHHHFGRRILCPNCPAPEESARAYCKDEGGKGAQDGLKRRQFRCRDAVRRRKETGEGCATLSCPAYIKRAIEVIGGDEVDGMRRGILGQLGDGGRDLSRITQRIQARRRSPTPSPPTKDAEGGPASTETDERSRTPPRLARGSDGARPATTTARPRTGAGVLRRFSLTEVVPLPPSAPPEPEVSRKRARSDAEGTRAERVTKLARQARALIEEIEKEIVPPGETRRQPTADGEGGGAEEEWDLEPPCDPESDDEFSGLLRLL
ncbi:hypothetical protein KC342_g16546 [Hortaea werneckii]|nr:hypothetical protein KC342_g16546 [Hortaea werneckii]KAI7379476.1 hypothetical protein KC328_g13309 [Hortaea werneckii]